MQMDNLTAEIHIDSLLQKHNFSFHNYCLGQLQVGTFDLKASLSGV